MTKRYRITYRVHLKRPISDVKGELSKLLLEKMGHDHQDAQGPSEDRHNLKLNEAIEICDKLRELKDYEEAHLISEIVIRIVDQQDSSY